MPRDLKTTRLIIISLLSTALISCTPQKSDYSQERGTSTRTPDIASEIHDSDEYDPPIRQISSTSQNTKKIALVIGNWRYRFKPLRNPANDAQKMAEVLGDLGFDVIHRENLSLDDMEDEVINFKRVLKNGQVGLFYFAGHGVEIASKNYLLPTDLRQTEAKFIKNNAVNAQWVVDVMEGSGSQINIVILDACRKIKLDRDTSGSGLAAMSAAKGTIISFATGSGQTAADGKGENGLYTGSLLKFIKQPGLTIERVFKKTRQVVADKSDGRQVPWESNSMVGDFCLVSCAKPPPPQPQRDRRAEIRLQEQLENERVKLEKERIKLEKERIKLEKERIKNIALQQQLDESKSNAPPPYEPPKPKPTVDNFKPGKVFNDRLKDGNLGPKMVWIPAGSFRMGDIQGGGDSDEKPVHRVSINRFAMSRYEVTFAEYDKFAEATGRSKPSDQGWGRGNRPVINVSWNDATAYAEWLSTQTGKQYRLPTEAEWEYAARAGTETKYWWGNEIGSNKANCWKSVCGDSFEYTAPVGSFAANSFGLYDTVGNVWEWTCSEYEKRYNGKETTRITKAIMKNGGENTGLFVLRGGSWFNDDGWSRTADRDRRLPFVRNWNYGFRLARIP
jgi:formylglycine-generating enzyme required for sulfatase activity